jgi:rod shape-determining protein MreC
MRDSERRVWSFADIGVRLVILSLAAMLIMALQLTGRLEVVQNAVAIITSPAQLSVTGLTDSVSSAVNSVREFRNLQQRNAELERINGSLLVENLRLREVERENQRLRELLAFAEVRPGLELRGGQIIARVIGQDSNNYLNFIMLDLGRRHGIRVGMPVVTDQGLVGRVSEVTETTSKVLLITDPTSTVNAILQSSRLTGAVGGRPGEDPIMDFIPQGAQFSVGEIVLTSGLGGNFPKGIPIGQVVEIRQRDFEIFQQAVIRPTVDFDRLELVMVVTSFDPLEFVPELDNPPVPPSGEPASETAPAGDQSEAPTETQ